jgi:putative ABC transport system permease protein
MRSLFQDLRHSVRRLFQSPGFTAVAVVTLALGIGAVTAIFSILHTLLLQPLPYEDPGRVAFVLGWNTAEDIMRFQVDAADYVTWREEAKSFAATAAYRNWSVNLSGEGPAERLEGYRVEPGTFELLGVRPAVGRMFRPEEARRGERVVVLSHSLWQRRFAGDRSVVGRTVSLNREPWTVVGVMPEGFEFPQFNFKGDLWGPLSFDTAELADRSNSFGVVAVARLAPGIPVKRAQAELDTIYRRLVADHPGDDEDRGVRVMPIQELLARQVRPALTALMAAVGLLLLIACANVAHLLLARSMERRREIAVRLALGAGRGQIVRQLLTESLVLAVASGLVGLLLASWILDALRGSIPDFLYRVMPALQTLGLHGPVLALCLGVAGVTGLVFGLVPALRLSRSGAAVTLREEGATSSRRHRTGAVLVAAEVALSVVLLVCAGLLLRSFWNLAEVDPGFRPEGVVVMETALPAEQYPDAVTRRAFFDELQRRVATLPGVTDAGWVSSLPLSTSNDTVTFRLEGQIPEPGETPRADLRIASPGYFQALGLARLEGRGIIGADDPEAPAIAVVNGIFADRYLGGDALGKTLELGEEATPFRVVGVVGNVKHWDLIRAPRPEIYVPLAQVTWSRMSLAVRTDAKPESLFAAIRAEVASLDPDQPVFRLSTLEASIARSLYLPTLSALLMGVFAGVALLLSAVGLAGVVAYAVGRRHKEIGIRMALGARPAQVVRLVTGQGMAAVVTGAVLGLGAALAASRLLAGQLFGVEPRDPWTFGTVAAVLVAVALFASWLPARRATRVDPRVALQEE